MLKTYLHPKLFITRVIHKAIGLVIALFFGVITKKFPFLFGFKNQYDVLGSTSDAILFVYFFLFLFLILFQGVKSHLIYVPSTYLNFNTEGVSFLRKKKEFKFITWDNINRVELLKDFEGLLYVIIVEKGGSSFKLELCHSWLLSLPRKRYVRHNFHKLMDIVHVNKRFEEKLIKEEIEDLYFYIK